MATGADQSLEIDDAVKLLIRDSLKAELDNNLSNPVQRLVYRRNICGLADGTALLLSATGTSEG